MIQIYRVTHRRVDKYNVNFVFSIIWRPIKSTNISKEINFMVFNYIQKLLYISFFFFDKFERRGITWLHVARTVFTSISAKHLVSFFKKPLNLNEDFCSKIDCILKSIWFKSGEDGNHSSLSQNDLTLSL